MANHRRGDVDCRIGAKVYPLRLTLGALAELESAFGADNLAALGERLAGGAAKASDLIALLGAAARGGGANLSDRDIAGRAGAADLPAIAEALARLFAITFGEDPPARPR